MTEWATDTDLASIICNMLDDQDANTRLDFDKWFDVTDEHIQDMPLPSWPKNHIWALIECENGIMADPGWQRRFCNVIGYVCSTAPHTVADKSIEMGLAAFRPEIWWVHDDEMETQYKQDNL